MELCDVILWTNRVRCALNMEILDLLNEESVSGARSSRELGVVIGMAHVVVLRTFPTYWHPLVPKCSVQKK